MLVLQNSLNIRKISQTQVLFFITTFFLFEFRGTIFDNQSSRALGFVI